MKNLISSLNDRGKFVVLKRKLKQALNNRLKIERSL